MSIPNLFIAKQYSTKLTSFNTMFKTWNIYNLVWFYYNNEYSGHCNSTNPQNYNYLVIKYDFYRAKSSWCQALWQLPLKELKL